MPLVSVATLLRVADRAAYQYEQILDTFDTISQTGLGLYWETVSATDDVDVEVPTERPYEEVDDDLDPSQVARTGTKLGNIIYGMDAHFNRRDTNGDPLQIGGWDGYLTSKDERVSQYFGELYFAIKGGYMLAVDVFSEGTTNLHRRY